MHWLFIYNWYTNTYAQVKWESSYSSQFHISKGMKQGSLLSPRMFNIFIDDLLKNLKSKKPGVRIHTFHINTFAYADDLNLLYTTASGLQKLINEYHNYAQIWRMKFNPLKTSIVCIGNQPHTIPPVWEIGNENVGLSEDTEVLGVTFDCKLDSNKHVKNRVRKCHQGIYKMSNIGLSYPGLNSDVKAFLWNTIGCPLLSYGMESIALSNSDIKILKTTQGNIIKRLNGFNKRSHHSKLLKALKVPSVEDVIKNNSLRLYKNIFRSDTPASELQSVLLARYIIKGTTTKGTLLEKVLKFGGNPLEIIFTNPPFKSTECDISYENDGVTDSLTFLLNHKDYNMPWSEEHILATLLTKAF